MDLHSLYPELNDLKRRTRKRVPGFVWEYLDSGTGRETALTRNRAALDQIGFLPSILHGEIEPDLTTTFLGQTYPLPFGMAPIGMSGLIWPGAEHTLARTAAAESLPFCLSNLANQSPEDIAPSLGANAWYQLYPPRRDEMRTDMLSRIRAAGFTTLVLTVDAPAAARRERLIRAGLQTPFKTTPKMIGQTLLSPAWFKALRTHGTPQMRAIEKYTDPTAEDTEPSSQMGHLLRTSPNWDYAAELRDLWDGPFIVKGVLRPQDAARLEEIGTDAVWVSNHAGRIFDAVPAAIHMLPKIRAAAKLPLIYDSGIEGGLDILRALALGADLVMLGRPFHYAVAALEDQGPAHLIDILRKDLVANLNQMGVARLSDLPDPVALD